jgi:hypothetical protein
VLGEDGDRWHTFAWLVLDVHGSEPESVHSYWPGATLMVDVVDIDVGEDHRRRAAMASVHGLRYVLIDVRRLRRCGWSPASYTGRGSRRREAHARDTG